MHLREALAQAERTLAGVSASAASDARLLLADSCEESPTWVLAHQDEMLPPEAEGLLADRLRRCAQGEPLPYVLGWWEFYGRRFSLTQDVLIPRPETEQIVERALAALRGRGEGARIIDIGTGSGCIAVSLAAEAPRGTVVATDVSLAALNVARVNAHLHHVEARIRLVQSWLFDGLAGRWDVVCANLPYIPTARLHRLAVGRAEPQLALDGGPRGTEVITDLLLGLGSHLAPGGLALVEIDEDQGDELAAVARRAVPRATVEIQPDLADTPRLLEVRRGGHAD